MTDTLRDLLARGADTIERPHLDVDHLVAQAEQRLIRRRIGAALGSVAVIALITTGGVALRTDGRLSPAPPATTTSAPVVPEPVLGPAIYFDALAVDGDELTDEIHAIGGPKDIYLVPDGGLARQIIATKANEHCPRVSPDGSALAYLQGEAIVVRRLGAAGAPEGEAVKVEPDVGEGGTSCPLWSPDGRQVAVAVAGFDLEAYEQTLEVRVISLDGKVRVVATRQNAFMPLSHIAWSPDGDAIAFTTPDAAWVARLDGSEAQLLWRGREPFLPSETGFPPYPGMLTGLWWLPTHEVVVTTHTDVDGREALRAIDPESGVAQVLATFQVDSPAWAWSPDGSRVVFASPDGLRMFDRVSGRTLPIQPRLDGQKLWFGTPVWSPDGDRLVGTAARQQDGRYDYALISVVPDGSSVTVLTPWSMALYSDADASWSPGRAGAQ